MVALANQYHWNYLEKSHWFMARLLCNNCVLPYLELLNSLHWKPMARLCIERQLLIIYKWNHGWQFLPDFVLEVKRCLQCQGHNMQISMTDHHHGWIRGILLWIQATQTHLHYSSSIWNKLPPHVPELFFEQFWLEIRSIACFNCLEETHQNTYNGYIIPPLGKYYQDLWFYGHFDLRLSTGNGFGYDLIYNDTLNSFCDFLYIQSDLNRTMQ